MLIETNVRDERIKEINKSRNRIGLRIDHQHVHLANDNRKVKSSS